MILIITDTFDAHADNLINILLDKNTQFFRFNVDVPSLKKTKVLYKDGNWIVEQNNTTLTLSEVKSIWSRRAFVELTLEEQDAADTSFKIWRAEWDRTLIGMYSSISDKHWLNKINNAYRAENKYYQLSIAKKVGLQYPETIVTNSKSEILKFNQKHGFVAFKLMNQDFYKADDGQYKGVFVNKLTENDFVKFGSIEENPIVLQKYIEKRYEVRYTVVGDEHHVCKIDSQKSKKSATDWRRYDLKNTPYEKIQPPEIIKEKVSKLMIELGLEYGALDFIVNEQSEWMFLEINPTGQYLWIEDLTGMKITNSVYNWLTNI